MEEQKAVITREIETIFSDRSNPNRLLDGIRRAEKSGGNALVLSQKEKLAESDKLLEQMLHMPAETWVGRKVKAVALLRHLEDQHWKQPDGHPDSDLARRSIIPLLRELAGAGAA